MAAHGGNIGSEGRIIRRMSVQIVRRIGGLALKRARKSTASQRRRCRHVYAEDR
jgi:hypothetical protein